MGQTEELFFGFPPFRKNYETISKSNYNFDKDQKTLFVNISPKSSKSMKVNLKGILTWKPEIFNLSTFSKGLILSSKGIPYFDLDLEEYGARSIATARPGYDHTCLVVECDEIHQEMNISRSDLIDSPKVTEFRKIVKELFTELEASKEYLEFRNLPAEEKVKSIVDYVSQEKSNIQQDDQGFVVFEKEGEQTLLLIREPKYEHEVDALIWKLESMKVLPFKEFQTLAYIGRGKGPDLLVNFQEDEKSELMKYTAIEVELNFYNYKPHGHNPAQYPKVICWDNPSSGRKMKLNSTSKKYKFTIDMDEYQVHVYVLKLMENIRTYSRRELARKGYKF